MKQIIKISAVSAVMALVLAFTSGCHRRPLHDADYGVMVEISLDKDIINYPNPADPELYRVVFFEHESGNYVTQAFVKPEGGRVYVLPEKSYDVLVYNFDTESTLIKNGNTWKGILATTNPISDEYKSKVKTRVKSMPAAVMQKLATKADPVNEVFVFDPDHLYVGRLENVFIPGRAVEAPIITLHFDAKTVVQTWIVDVGTIQGVKNIAGVSAVMTGLASGNNFGPNAKTDDAVTVYFDDIKISADGILIGKFNTFGATPVANYPQVLTLIFTDTIGQSYIYNVDVSDQFINNPNQYIKVRTSIIIPDPPVGPTSGGFVPKVDEWNDIVSTIEI